MTKKHRLLWKRGVGYWRAQSRRFFVWTTWGEFKSQAAATQAIEERMVREAQSRRDTRVVYRFDRA